MLHGRLLAGLAARAVEGAGHDPALRVVRLTVDMFRTPPMTPLHVATHVIRDGRRVRVVDVSIRTADVEVARASALLLRSGPHPDAVMWRAPEWTVALPETLPSPGERRYRRRVGHPAADSRRILDRRTQASLGPRSLAARRRRGPVPGGARRARRRSAESPRQLGRRGPSVHQCRSHVVPRPATGFGMDRTSKWPAISATTASRSAAAPCTTPPARSARRRCAPSPIPRRSASDHVIFVASRATTRMTRVRAACSCACPGSRRAHRRAQRCSCARCRGKRRGCVKTSPACCSFIAVIDLCRAAKSLTFSVTTARRSAVAAASSSRSARPISSGRSLTATASWPRARSCAAAAGACISSSSSFTLTAGAARLARSRVHGRPRLRLNATSASISSANSA